MTGPPVDRLRAARRVLVLGPSGAGKTRLAIELGDALQLPVVHLDAERWQPGWLALDDASWRRRVAALVAEPAWVLDGTYESTLDARVPAADVVVLLEPPRFVCLWGLLVRRAVVRDTPRVDAPAGQRLDRAFLRYAWRYGTDTRPLVLDALDRHDARERTLVLRSRRAGRRLAAHLAGPSQVTRPARA